MSPVNLRYASESDSRSLGVINIKSFSSNGFIPNTFPEASLDSLFAFKGAISLKHLANPKTHVLVGTDPDSDQIICYCRWMIPQGIGYDAEPVPLSQEGTAALQDPMRFAPRPMREEIYNAAKGWLEEKRRQHTTEDDFVLDLLATLPGHQGKGIGSMFLKWGLEKADASKRRVYLEATPEGYPLYYKYGWRPVEEQFTLDFTQYGGVGSQTFVVMMRDPQ